MDNILEHISSRIRECASECSGYSSWLTKLRLPNSILVACGSLLAFLGGAAMLNDIAPDISGIMALMGGALTGLHGWFGCEAHQSECKTLLGKFESLKSRYETLLVEPDKEKMLAQFRDLEAELANVKGARQARPWKGFLDFGKPNNKTS